MSLKTNLNKLSTRWFPKEPECDPSYQDVVSKVSKIIRGVTGCAEVELTSTKEDLGMDSLDELEVLMDIESEYNLDIPTHVVDTFKTVEDIVEYVCLKERVTNVKM